MTSTRRLLVAPCPIERLVTSGPAVDLEASGTLELDGVRSSQIAYHVTRSDLSKLASTIGRETSGELITAGRLTGPLDRMRFVGDGTLTRLAASGVEALTTSATYDALIPTDDPRGALAIVKGRLSSVTAFGQSLQVLDASATYDAGRVSVALDGVVREGLEATLPEHSCWTSTPDASPSIRSR